MTNDTRRRIVRLFQGGDKPPAIAKNLKRAESSVRDVITRWKEGKLPELGIAPPKPTDQGKADPVRVASKPKAKAETPAHPEPYKPEMKLPKLPRKVEVDTSLTDVPEPGVSPQDYAAMERTTDPEKWYTWAPDPDKSLPDGVRSAAGEFEHIGQSRIVGFEKSRDTTFWLRPDVRVLITLPADLTEDEAWRVNKVVDACVVRPSPEPAPVARPWEEHRDATEQLDLRNRVKANGVAIDTLLGVAEKLGANVEQIFDWQRMTNAAVTDLKARMERQETKPNVFHFGQEIMTRLKALETCNEPIIKRICDLEEIAERLTQTADLLRRAEERYFDLGKQMEKVMDVLTREQQQAVYNGG